MVRVKFALFFLLVGGCAATAPAVEVESVGNLTRSDTHVTQQAVHETTDLHVVANLDVAQSAKVSAKGQAEVEGPEVVAKHFGF
jgi:hypothetical protein